ncbi:response regulator [Chitinophaga polysaccharea]|uniref:response regulator n=1 Tax=Chitinophaga TaxID=79328 RepID=UPI001454FB11|nr:MULTISPECIES: response regulator [Chitinophaga]NLR58527.1 response regulator [Chitinophaga polysaccharea]NLU91055.1 response regulator [Chitinophaga sp. Ak27]
MKLIDTIFIVDDDPIHQQIAKIMIERQAISNHIRVFSDAQDVLDYLRTNAGSPEALPDLILLDLNMPVMDGWEFLEEYAGFCTELPKNIRIFVLTSSIDEKDKERVSGYSFVTGYLTKPLSKEIIAHLS